MQMIADLTALETMLPTLSNELAEVAALRQVIARPADARPSADRLRRGRANAPDRANAPG